jgi:hypothetical protein
MRASLVVEAPVDLRAVLVVVPLPSHDLAPYGCEVQNATMQALADEGALFDLGDLAPWKIRAVLE